MRLSECSLEFNSANYHVPFNVQKCAFDFFSYQQQLLLKAHCKRTRQRRSGLEIDGFHIEEPRLRALVTYLSSLIAGSRLLATLVGKPHSIATGSSGRLPDGDRRMTSPCLGVFLPVGKISRGIEMTGFSSNASYPHACITAVCRALSR